MKKKAIESIPYLGLKKSQQKERCQIYWCHDGQDYRTRKASFPGGVQEQKRIKGNTAGEDRAYEKRFQQLFSGKRKVDTAAG